MNVIVKAGVAAYLISFTVSIVFGCLQTSEAIANGWDGTYWFLTVIAVSLLGSTVCGGLCALTAWIFYRESHFKEVK